MRDAVAGIPNNILFRHCYFFLFQKLHHSVITNSRAIQLSCFTIKKNGAKIHRHTDVPMLSTKRTLRPEQKYSRTTDTITDNNAQEKREVMSQADISGRRSQFFGGKERVKGPKQGSKYNGRVR